MSIGEGRKTKKVITRNVHHRRALQRTRDAPYMCILLLLALLYYENLIPRNLRGFLVAGDVLEVDPVVLQAARVVVVRVIVVVLLARLWSRCCAAAATVAAAAAGYPGRRCEWSCGPADVGDSPWRRRRLTDPLSAGAEGVWVVGSCAGGSPATRAETSYYLHPRSIIRRVI